MHKESSLMTSSGKQEEVMRVLVIEILRVLSSLQCRGGVSSHYVILPGHWTCDVEITVLGLKGTEGQRGNGLVQDSVSFGSCISKLVPFPPSEGTWNGFRGKLKGRDVEWGHLRVCEKSSYFSAIKRQLEKWPFENFTAGKTLQA